MVADGSVSFRVASCMYDGVVSGEEERELSGTSSCRIDRVKDLVDVPMDGPWRAEREP